MIVFVLAMTTVALATYSNWFKNRTAPWVGRVMLSVPVVLAVVVMRQVSLQFWNGLVAAAAFTFP